jgi:hypothetical protein
VYLGCNYGVTRVYLDHPYPYLHHSYTFLLSHSLTHTHIHTTHTHTHTPTMSPMMALKTVRVRASRLLKMLSKVSVLVYFIYKVTVEGTFLILS